MAEFAFLKGNWTALVHCEERRDARLSLIAFFSF
jgi:hypothetical protein